MRPLRQNEKEVVFDYCLGLTGAEPIVSVRRWLANNEQAADLHVRLQVALRPRRSLRPQRRPTNLAEGTMRLLGAEAGTARAAADTDITYSYVHK